MAALLYPVALHALYGAGRLVHEATSLESAFSAWAKGRSVPRFGDILAPLTVPLLMSVLALQLLLEVRSLYWFGLLLAAVVSYAGALLVGAPANVVLRSCSWTAFWLAPVVGSVIGVIMAITLVVIFPLVLESGILASVVAMFADGSHWGGTVFIAKPDSAEVLIGPGILGAFVGTVLWFIGRPDRP